MIIDKMNNINNKATKLVFPTTYGVIFIRLEKICFFKSNDNYCILFDINGKEYFITKSLKWIENKMKDYCLYRVHKYYFINIYNIIKYNKKGSGSLTMECDTIIPISRTKKADIALLIKSLEED